MRSFLLLLFLLGVSLLWSSSQVVGEKMWEKATRKHGLSLQPRRAREVAARRAKADEKHALQRLVEYENMLIFGAHRTAVFSALIGSTAFFQFLIFTNAPAPDTFKKTVLGAYIISLIGVAYEYFIRRVVLSAFFLMVTLTFPLTVAAVGAAFPFGTLSKAIQAAWNFVFPFLLIFSYFYQPSSEGLLPGPKDLDEISFQDFLGSNVFKDGLVRYLIVSHDKARAYLYLEEVPVSKPPQEPIEDKALGRTIPSDDRSKDAALKPDYYFTLGSLETFEKLMKVAQDDLAVKKGPAYMAQGQPGYIPIFFEPSPEPPFSILPIMQLYFLFTVLSRFQGSPAEQTFRLVKAKEIKVTFADVIGHDLAKIEIQEFIDFLKDDEKYKEIGAVTPKGALMVGPPGTGKTLIAKAIAGESKVNFIQASGSDFDSMYVGAGAKKVRELFALARTNEPCIIFIDEIDAIGMSRDGPGTKNYSVQTLNALLVEMDGFAKQKVMIFGATNRLESLDPALTRPGRFDRKVDIPLPSIQGRQELYSYFITKRKPVVKIDSSVTSDAMATLAKVSYQMSGADIGNVVNDAAIIAVRNGKDKVSYGDLKEAITRQRAGYERPLIQSAAADLSTARHEAGHTICAWMSPYGPGVSEVTIVARSKGSGGHTAFKHAENAENSSTKKQIQALIVSALGGFAAESIFYGENVSTGPSKDLKHAADLAMQMITSFGFDTSLGPFKMPTDSFGKLLVSSKTQELVDQAVQDLLKKSLDEAKKIIQDNRGTYENLVNKLIKDKVLEEGELQKILGPKTMADPHALVDPDGP